MIADWQYVTRFIHEWPKSALRYRNSGPEMKRLFKRDDRDALQRNTSKKIEKAAVIAPQPRITREGIASFHKQKSEPIEGSATRKRRPKQQRAAAKIESLPVRLRHRAARAPCTFTSPQPPVVQPAVQPACMLCYRTSLLSLVNVIICY